MTISFFEHWNRSGCDYNTGVEFYLNYGQNNTLKKVFQFGATQYTESKLKAELFQLKHIRIVLAKTDKPKIIKEKLPAHLQLEYDKLGILIKEISFKNAQLELLPSDQVRLQYASEIIDAVQKRREIYNRIDYYVAHGIDLVKTDYKAEKENNFPIDNLTRQSLKKDLARLRSKRSKLSKDATKVVEFNKVCIQISDIEKQLK